MQSKGLCIFCGQPGLTKEHLWPQWVAEVVPAGPAESMFHSVRSSEIAPFRYWTSEGFRKGKLHNTGSVLSRKIRVVCGRCNNGWMSGIQQRARPILEPLIRGDISQVGEAAQAIIADWITMSAMVAEFALPEGVLLSSSERMNFSQSFEKPVLTRAWVGLSAASEWDKRFQTSHASYVHNTDNGDKPCKLVAHTASIGKLFTHIIFWNEMDEFMDFDEYQEAFKLQPVHPLQGAIILSESINDSELTILSRIIRDMLIDTANVSL